MFAAGAATSSFAYDGDGSGVSDVYEELHGRALPFAEDADLDGYTNYFESLFGSDPLDPKSPGALNFRILGETAQIDVPEQLGLRFRLESSRTLATDSWAPLGDFIVADGSASVEAFELGEHANNFFRVELVEPLNSDSDGLNDWEEAQLGTDPGLADTDNDLLDDDIETMVSGTNPHKVDSDGDGFVDRDEYVSGSDGDDETSWPPEIFQNPWSQPVSIRNTAGPAQFFSELWSNPVVISNAAGPAQQFTELWSNQVVVSNLAGPAQQFTEVWSNPILIRNEGLSLLEYGELWSAPILIRNSYTAP